MMGRKLNRAILTIAALTTLWLSQSAQAVPGQAVETLLHPGAAPVDARRFAATVRSLGLSDVCDLANVRPSLLEDWAMRYGTLRVQVEGKQRTPRGAAEQVYDPNTLCHDTDIDPLGVVLRRTKALLACYQQRYPELELPDYHAGLDVLAEEGERMIADANRRLVLYYAACALRRQVALRNPLLDFDRILFVARANDTRDLWDHRGIGSGRHFVTQYCAFASLPGGGIYVVEDFKTNPVVKDILDGRSIANGPHKGKRITGGVYLSPELSFDAEKLLFAWSPVARWNVRWEEGTVWHIYEANTEDGWATQLTFGPYNDFDPCYLPSGRIAFISERRGGYVRCFDAMWPTRNFVLHSMKPGGSDIIPISWFETCEWQPSLANDGRIVYTRWDYVDRDFGQGQNLWLCYPDGRDPRAPHGNYPRPFHVPTEQKGLVRDGRRGRPFCEFNIRAVPDSHKYVACAAPQHGLTFGSLVMIDMRDQADDGHMSQVRRLTPYQAFPETERPAFSSLNPQRWGTPWPLDEDFFLCNYMSGIYLLDRFGNLTVLCEKELIPGWERVLWLNHRQGDNGFRLIDPIPVKPRPVPPVVPAMTNQGEDARSDAPKATIAVMNVYDADMPLSDGVKIKHLRIVQHLAKSNAEQDDPCIGLGVNNSAKMALGVVPVEEDGSVYCEAPVGKLLIFQLLDEDYRAVHSMRSATYVHPGEQLSCVGCHEQPTVPRGEYAQPLALRRPPSKLEPEVGGLEPITYYRTVKPVFERSCIPCHERERKGPRKMSYALLQDYVWYYYGGETDDVRIAESGGSRTMPGRFGSYNCRMGKALVDSNHLGKIPEEDFRRVVLWLDNNSPRYGACHSSDEQESGRLVWPKLDVDPRNPQGLERLWDAAAMRSLDKPAYLSVSDFHRLRGTINEMNERPDWTVSGNEWDGGPGQPRGWIRSTWRDW